MNQFTFDSSWNQMKGKLRQRYGQLTDDDLSFAEGKGEELLGRLQEKLGLSQDDLNTTLHDIRGSLDNTASGVREKFETAKARVGETAGEWKAAATDRAEEVYGQARERARTIYEDAEEYVRQKPREALFSALAAGFVVGLLFKR